MTNEWKNMSMIRRASELREMPFLHPSTQAQRSPATGLKGSRGQQPRPYRWFGSVGDELDMKD